MPKQKNRGEQMMQTKTYCERLFRVQLTARNND